MKVKINKSVLVEAVKNVMKEAVPNLPSQHLYNAGPKDKPTGEMSYNDLADIAANNQRMLVQMGFQGVTQQDVNSNSRKFYSFLMDHLFQIKRGLQKQLGQKVPIASVQKIKQDWLTAKKTNKNVNEAVVDLKPQLKKKMRFLKSKLSSETGRQRKQVQDQIRQLQQELVDLDKDLNEGYAKSALQKFGGDKQKVKQWAKRHWNVLNDKAKQGLKAFGPAMIPQKKELMTSTEDLNTFVL